jgi:hypothetical protein
MDASAFDKSELRDCCGGALHRSRVAGHDSIAGRHLENVKRGLNQMVVRFLSHPTSAACGTVALRGNAEKVTLDGQSSIGPFATGRRAWMGQANLSQSGARQVGPARRGAVASGGGKAKVDYDADI